MKLIIQHEFIKEFTNRNYGSTKREIEKDALDFIIPNKSEPPEGSVIASAPYFLPLVIPLRY